GLSPLCPSRLHVVMVVMNTRQPSFRGLDRRLTVARRSAATPQRMNGESPMSKLLASAAIAVSVLASSTALAAEKTITLAVKNMYCADCPFIVRKSLEAVPGVSKAVVSYKDKTAVVTYDDTKADVAALTRATTEAGYPSAPRS